MALRLSREKPSLGSKLPLRLDEIMLTKLSTLTKLGITQIFLYFFAALAIFTVGYDQGHILETFLGVDAPGINRIHELFHDIRHIAGYMCH